MPLNHNTNPIRAMFEANAAARKADGATAAPTLAEAIEEQKEAEAVRITEIEQFQYNQKLTPQESVAVELICTHESAAHVDAAIAALQRLRRLAYPLALLVALLFLPSCIATVTYNPATNTMGIQTDVPVSKFITPTK